MIGWFVVVEYNAKVIPLLEMCVCHDCFCYWSLYPIRADRIGSHLTGSNPFKLDRSNRIGLDRIGSDQINRIGRRQSGMELDVHVAQLLLFSVGCGWVGQRGAAIGGGRVCVCAIRFDGSRRCRHQIWGFSLLNDAQGGPI